MDFVTRIVAPVSAWTRGTSCSVRSSTSSATRSRSAARSSGVVRLQVWKASAAAAVASSDWSTVACGAFPTTSSVAGFTTS